MSETFIKIDSLQHLKPDGSDSETWTSIVYNFVVSGAGGLSPTSSKGLLRRLAGPSMTKHINELITFTDKTTAMIIISIQALQTKLELKPLLKGYI